MKRMSMFRQLALLLAVAGLTLASVAQGADSARPLVSDVALQPGNVLSGQILDHQGAPQANVDVALLQQGKAIAFTRTNEEGSFVVRGVRAGVYQVETPRGGASYRLWAPQTAPPAAKQGALIVGNADVARGQVFGDEYGPAIRGAVAGGLIAGGTYWALDYNPTGS